MLDRQAAAAVTASPDMLDLLGPRERLIFRAHEEAAIRLAGEAFGVPLPREACRFNANGSRSARWLGPDEWMLVVEDGAPEADIAAIESAIGTLAHSLVDVSHRSVTLALSGPHAEDILASGCPLDLALASFLVGMCTRTILGKAEIVLARTGPATFEIDVWRSFASYVRLLLEEARREFV
jgi:sarcosine oxidase, subunit gamma